MCGQNKTNNTNGVGSNGKQLVSLKRGFGFEFPCMQQHPLINSPVIVRHATRGNHQISPGNPDTGGGD
jgi:hypothetical protein